MKKKPDNSQEWGEGDKRRRRLGPVVAGLEI